MFERFTDRGRAVLVLAQEEARLLNHSFIGTEHILLGLIHEGGLAAEALQSLGISLPSVRAAVAKTIGPAASASAGSPQFTPRAKNVLELSLREALQLGDNHIGAEHLLLGLVREGEGVGAQVLRQLGADPTRVRQVVIGLLSASAPGFGEEVNAAVGVAGTRLRVRSPKAPEERRFSVGRRWSAEVVVTGRRPEDFAAAYDQLSELAGQLGLEDLNASRLHLSSVETADGAGLRLSFTYELPAELADDEKDEEPRQKAP